MAHNLNHYLWAPKKGGMFGMVGNVYHPKLINALRHVVASKDKQSEHFETSLKGIITDHLDGLLNWMKTIETILPELGSRDYQSVSKVHANNEEDFSLCQMAIDDWELLDRAVGMRYNALVKRCSKLSTVTVRQITLNQLNSLLEWSRRQNIGKRYSQIIHITKLSLIN